MQHRFWLKLIGNSKLNLKISIVPALLILGIWIYWLLHHENEANIQLISNHILLYINIFLTILYIISIIYSLVKYHTLKNKLTINNNDAHSIIPYLKSIGYQQIIIRNEKYPITQLIADDNRLNLDFIGRYRSQNMLTSWTDYLHTASITIELDTIWENLDYHPKPQSITVNQTQKSDSLEIIGNQKKIQEDLFDFKHFETGDDPRRIVWKIYGKNRTLQVRKADDTYFDQDNLHIYIVLPKEKTPFSFVINTLLWTNYKKAVLNHLAYLDRHFQISITLGEETYTFNQAFIDTLLSKTDSKATNVNNTKEQAIIMISNIDENELSDDLPIILYDLSIEEKKWHKSKIIFRTPSEITHQNQAINNANKILRANKNTYNNTAIDSYAIKVPLV